MKVSFNWLADHLDLSAHSTAQLSDLLTFAGIEVEGITERGVRSDFLIVGQVISFVPHPNADRLRVCRVDAGVHSKDGLLQIVFDPDNAETFAAAERLRSSERESFLAQEWPVVRARIDRLGLSLAELLGENA